MKIAIVFYSMYGHVYALAKAAAEGVRRVEGAEVSLYRVAETLPEEILERMGALDFSRQLAAVPLASPEVLETADAIIFGTPTRFGNMCGQMRQFLDSTGGLWQRGALVGKLGSVLVSSATQHGGQESTILSFHITLLHHGMLVVGLPYAFSAQSGVDEIKGGSPYGATTIAGSAGERQPSAVELDGARYQGEHVARLTAKLTA